MSPQESADLVVVMISEHNIQVPSWIRPLCRALNYISYHKTFVDEFGNFKALFTDGVRVWCKLADDRIVIMELANIVEPKTMKSASSGQPKRKPTSINTKPKKSVLKVLRALIDLEIDLTPKQLAIYTKWKHLL